MSEAYVRRAPEKGGARLCSNRALSLIAAQYSQDLPKNNVQSNLRGSILEERKRGSGRF
jgi:hypothetical protein